MRATPLCTQKKQKKGCPCLVSRRQHCTELYASEHSCPGILNNTKTSFGRSLLRQWLFRPSSSISVITARHDALSAFLRPENLATSASMHNHLKGIKNVPRILSCLKNGKAKLTDWQGLVKVCYFCSDYTSQSYLILNSSVSMSPCFGTHWPSCI